MPPSEGLVSRVQYWLRGLQQTGKIALCAAILSCILAPVWWFVENRVTTVAFERPHIRINAGVKLPADFSTPWLIDEAKQALSSREHRLRVVGDFGADKTPVTYTARTSEEKPLSPDQTYAMSLRCQSDICVFNIQRSVQGESKIAQGLMFADASLQSWRGIIHRTVDDLVQQ
jgi:hypothetical protein